jgi:hypothetical protein
VRGATPGPGDEMAAAELIYSPCGGVPVGCQLSQGWALSWDDGPW